MHNEGAGGIVLVIGPAVRRTDISALCARLTDLVRPVGPVVVICDASQIVEPSIATVEALARLRLTARRFGADIRVRGGSPGLRRLLALTGLDEVIRDASALEPHRQAEQGEQPRHIEEVGDRADPAV